MVLLFKRYSLDCKTSGWKLQSIFSVCKCGEFFKKISQGESHMLWSVTVRMR